MGAHKAEVSKSAVMSKCLLGGRLTVGQQPLKLYMKVRLLPPQPTRTRLSRTRRVLSKLHKSDIITNMREKFEFVKLFLALSSPFLALWGIYLVYNPPIPQNVFTEAANATSTIPLIDILVRANDFKTSYETTNFLKTYDGKDISARGTYNNFFGENQYYVIVHVGANWFMSWRKPYQVACALKDSEQSVKDTLMLLKNGQTVYFVGKFRNGNLNGYYYPIIDDCVLLKT